MCHPRAKAIIKASDLNPEPIEENKCHIYYIHQEGLIFSEPNVSFNDGPTNEDSSRNYTQEDSEVQKRGVNSCGQDRLILIHLPKSTIVPFPPPTALENKDEGLRDTSPESFTTAVSQMPRFFKERLESICSHCSCKGTIVWRNLHRAEPHFDSCFRYCDEQENPTHRCFVKLYSMRVPFLAAKPVTLSLVHHIRAEGHTFVSKKSDSNNQEHIFTFVAGFSSKDIGRLLTDLFTRWQDLPYDHLKSSTGMTPKLFMAAIISQYGHIVSQDIMAAGQKLVRCDESLRISVDRLKKTKLGSTEDDNVTEEIQKMNETLITMTRGLTGTRSTMHYLADSADLLVNRISAFPDYISKRLSEWEEHPDPKCLKKLKRTMRRLDSCREAMRDKDKLELVRKNMQQYKFDIKALQQHIDINVAMVRNLIAERDRAIQLGIQRDMQEDRKVQQVIARNTDRDNFNMRVTAALTAMFLPGTFLAVLFTTPMFDWSSSSVIVRLPFKIYWAVTGSVTVILAIGLSFLAYPGWVNTIIDSIPFNKMRIYLQGTYFYRVCKEKSDEMQGIADAKKLVRVKSVNNNEEAGKDESTDDTVDEQSLDNDEPELPQNGEVHNSQNGNFRLSILSVRGVRSRPKEVEVTYV